MFITILKPDRVLSPFANTGTQFPYKPDRLHCVFLYEVPSADAEATPLATSELRAQTQAQAAGRDGAGTGGRGR